MTRGASRGVTLVELAVVLALVALLLMAVVPSASAWIRNTQIRNVATAIQNGLQRARAEAMRRNTPVRFSLVQVTDPAVLDNSCALSSSGVSWVVSIDDPTSKCATAVSDATAPRILDKQAGGSGAGRVAVAAVDADGDEAVDVVFNGFGRTVDGTGISRVSIDNEVAGDDYRALRIVIGTGGTIRMCEPKVTDSTDPRKC